MLPTHVDALKLGRLLCLNVWDSAHQVVVLSLPFFSVLVLDPQKMPRLLRFGSELIFYECEQLNVEVIIINHDVNATPEQELVQDVLEVITVFSARLYGRLMPSKQIPNRGIG